MPDAAPVIVTGRPVILLRGRDIGPPSRRRLLCAIRCRLLGGAAVDHGAAALGG
jgi:hypothetical protein